MPDASIPVAEAALLLGVPEEEAEKLADPGGRVPLETIRDRVGVAAVALELARSREEVGRLSGQLEEVRASNARLQKKLEVSVEERRRLTQEVLELRAAAEERLMLMERIEHTLPASRRSLRRAPLRSNASEAGGYWAGY
jgi:hypothetical protein